MNYSDFFHFKEFTLFAEISLELQLVLSFLNKNLDKVNFDLNSCRFEGFSIHMKYSGGKLLKMAVGSSSNGGSRQK